MSSNVHSLRSHSQINKAASKSRICRYCFKTFSKLDHLARHERTHTRERPFKCHDCEKTYSRHDTLLRHCKARKHATAGPESSRSDNRALSPSRTNDAAATLANIQSMSDRLNHSQINHTLATSQSVAENDSNHTSEALLIDPNLENVSANVDNRVYLAYSSNTPQEPEASQYPEHLLDDDSTFSPPVMGTWGIQMEPFASWHIGEDFDLEAFNTSLLSPSLAEHLVWQGLPAGASDSSSAESNEDAQPLSSSIMYEVQSLWITKTDNNSLENGENASYSVSPTGSMTPKTESPSGTTVDDRYRGDLSRRISPRWKEDPLPSTEFLNAAIHLFFTKFNPLFPILHRPTFQASNYNSLLLLSMCSIGSLFMGSAAAAAHGSRIFERLNKVVLASWENIANKQTAEGVYMVQAAVIGQTFAYLSGDPKHIATAESFHGTNITFAQRCGLFSSEQNIPHIVNQSPQELEELWVAWARSEEITRTVLGLYIHDARHASMFHHNPTLRHNSIQLSAAASNALFGANTAAQWAGLMKQLPPKSVELSTHIHLHQPQHTCNRPLAAELACKNSRFSCYVLLHGIGASVQESNISGSMTSANRDKYTDALICWYHAYEKSMPANEIDPCSLMILYHEIFMQLLVDFNELERAIGRDGPDEAAYALQYIRPWSSSLEAKRCVIHASLIHRQVSSMRIDSEPALHVPWSMFLAALVWYCYIEFDEGQPSTAQNSQLPLDLLEAKLFNVNPYQYLVETSVPKKGMPTLHEASPLGSLTDMLPRTGHWGVSKRLSRILKLLIHGEQNL